MHKRKRMHEKLEVYPHPNKWVKFLDRFLITTSHTFHCVHNNSHEYDTSFPLSGSGYFPAFK